MHMLYNSDQFAVVRFEMTQDPVSPDAPGAPTKGGYEIVDKLLRKEIFLQGPMAEQFQAGVESLMQNSPSEEELDDYIAGYSALAQQPLVLH
jgi:Protein of unknown function (DUF3567)